MESGGTPQQQLRQLVHLRLDVGVGLGGDAVPHHSVGHAFFVEVRDLVGDGPVLEREGAQPELGALEALVHRYSDSGRFNVLRC